MGALPKNKITRVERGKRRAGNTPKLKKDTKISSIPFHKRGLVASMLRSIGLSAAQTTEKTSKKKVQTKSVSQKPLPTQPKIKQPVVEIKTAAKRQTQHKG
ncbi:MAG: hypothetical protein COY80_00545 [Candidatus Pacebacteria bacterium CG_4_10_14_0_8_um_filter_42_14]|nr:MAG: hypothetical protein COY80_00545 [Candidatus Pacebacteria bacterium CG_4_10_14_0_8_um_filter_42_14]